MKKFLIKITAYGYITEFTVKADNSSQGLENAILDKLGKNDIVWDKDGFTSKSKTWLTYEEVIDGTRSEPLHEKKESRTGVVAAL